MAIDAYEVACFFSNHETSVPHDADFHTLSSAQVNVIIQAADFCKYKKPANVNGSRARYFYAAFQRKYLKRQY